MIRTTLGTYNVTIYLINFSVCLIFSSRLFREKMYVAWLEGDSTLFEMVLSYSSGGLLTLIIQVGMVLKTGLLWQTCIMTSLNLTATAVMYNMTSFYVLDNFQYYAIFLIKKQKCILSFELRSWLILAFTLQCRAPTQTRLTTFQLFLSIIPFYLFKTSNFSFFFSYNFGRNMHVAAMSDRKIVTQQ